MVLKAHQRGTSYFIFYYYYRLDSHLRIVEYQKREISAKNVKTASFIALGVDHNRKQFQFGDSSKYLMKLSFNNLMF